ncbi:hypothetical protein ABLI39_03950 [Pseudarthrobacter sp. B907]|uniref:hypothetical protein n=1 Tax=Pseudarthrobacter sp. B907 TaxID=3158261 RepID=UPI0032DB7B0C
MTDIWWQGVPNWIVAVTSVLTLLAAITAGYFAGQAAKWTKKQAEASDEQVAIGRTSLDLAHGEALLAQSVAARQRQEADEAYRNFAEAKLDRLAPVILATAKLSRMSPLTVYKLMPSGAYAYATLSESYSEEEQREIHFRQRLAISFRNVSDQIARLSIIDLASGELENHPQGREIIVAPHETEKFIWERRWSPQAELATEEEINDVRSWLFNFSFWVRDLGMNVQDTYVFNGDLRFFARDGSRLLVRDEPEHAWTEDVAVPSQMRVYERLDALAQTGQPS